MLHNLKNFPRRQIHLLKRIKRENTLKISLICLKHWMDGSAVPVGLRGFTSDAEEIQKMPTSFNLQPQNASWFPPSNSMTQSQSPMAPDGAPGMAVRMEGSYTLPSRPKGFCCSSRLGFPTACSYPALQKRWEGNPGPPWFGFPPGKPVKGKPLCSNLSRKSCHAGVVDGD